MQRYLSIGLLLFLMSCYSPKEALHELETTAITGVAYNEHVESNVGGIATEVKINGTSVSFFQQGNKVFFDLPNPPFPFTALPSSDAAYTNRGIVNVSVTVTNSQTPVERSYQPYGAVESGQVNVLIPLQNACPASGYYKGFRIANSFFSTDGAAATRLCFLTLDIRNTQTVNTTRRGTSQAITYLKNQHSNEIAIDSNKLLSLDGHRPVLSYDPSCKQIEKWVSNENSNKQRIEVATILSEVNATTAHTSGILGTGVRVAVLGGGVDISALTNSAQVVVNTSQNFIEPGQEPIEDFECDFDGNGTPDFQLHDTHGIEIIKTIAPNATVIPFKICDHDGNCPTAYVVMALMYLENAYNGRIIANISAGGPLLDETLLRFLESDPNRPNESFFVVASAGNNGRAVSHRPATFSPLTNPPGSSPSENLQNVISVAAYGITTKGAYTLPPFNTRQNSNLLAPGVNLCLPSVAIQCQGTTDPGIGGTSFAAPMVAGVAALYTQAQPGANLFNLLTSNAQSLNIPNTTLRKVWYQ
jgi:hypothetical protein